MHYILYVSWSSQWKQKLFLLGLGHRKPPLLGWTPCWWIKAAIKTDRRSYWVWLAPLALLWSKLHVPHWPLHQCILWGQFLLWSPLRVPENPIMHSLCQLTQLYNRNHAAHWILGGYCRREQVCPGAGEEMVYMWVYFSPPSAAPAPIQTLVSFWGPWRHGLLFAVKTVWSLCLFVFYRLIKTQVLHACPHREAPGPHL